MKKYYITICIITTVFFTFSICIYPLAPIVAMGLVPTALAFILAVSSWAFCEIDKRVEEKKFKAKLHWCLFVFACSLVSVIIIAFIFGIAYRENILLITLFAAMIYCLPLFALTVAVCLICKLCSFIMRKKKQIPNEITAKKAFKFESAVFTAYYLLMVILNALYLAFDNDTIFILELLLVAVPSAAVIIYCFYSLGKAVPKNYYIYCALGFTVLNLLFTLLYSPSVYFFQISLRHCETILSYMINEEATIPIAVCALQIAVTCSVLIILHCVNLKRNKKDN